MTKAPPPARGINRVGTAGWVVIAASAPTFWLLMMSVHELGHAAAAWATGGQVTHVALSPVSLSRTDVSPNPSPLTVAWSGSLFGAAVPVLVCTAATLCRWPLRRWLVAFAGFCLLTNGLYLASGTVTPAGDTQDLLRLGAPAVVLGLAGVPMALGGLWLWHTLGPGWGLPAEPRHRVRRWAWSSAAVLAVVVAVMLIAAGA